MDNGRRRCRWQPAGPVRPVPGRNAEQPGPRGTLAVPAPSCRKRPDDGHLPDDHRHGRHHVSVSFEKGSVKGSSVAEIVSCLFKGGVPALGRGVALECGLRLLRLPEHAELSVVDAAADAGHVGPVDLGDAPAVPAIQQQDPGHHAAGAAVGSGRGRCSCPIVGHGLFWVTLLRLEWRLPVDSHPRSVRHGLAVLGGVVHPGEYVFPGVHRDVLPADVAGHPGVAE